MAAPALTPAALDEAAARIVGPCRLDPAAERSWAGIVASFDRTAPAAPAARALLTKTVDELVAEALDNCPPEHGQAPAVEVRLPGRLTRALPEWTHRRYRANASLPPSVQLHVAAVILRDWGWQAQPHQLRDRRGRRCVCGAICAAVALGVGTQYQAEIAAGHVLAELRDRGWPHYIGQWNSVAGRTQAQAIHLLTHAEQRARAAGQ